MIAMRYKLAEHQKLALEIMACNPHLGIFYQMGCGKTMIILEWIRNALKQGMIKDALVVCPASLVPSWKQAISELDRFEGFGDRDIERIKEALTITSYQKTWNSVKQVSKDKLGRVTVKKVVQLRDNLDKYWGAVIYDESHSIGNHDSNQTKSAITLGQLARYRFCLSGTPVHGGKGREDFAKLYGQIQFLSGGTAFKNWTSFCREYVLSYDMWHKPSRYDVQKCRKLLQNYGIVCRLEDCFDMPGKTDQDIPCPLTEKTVYEDIRTGNIDAYGIEIENAGGQYQKMLQVCSGSLKVDNTKTLQLRTSKDDALGDILNGTDDPIVIFCTYTASVDRCKAVAKRAGKKVAVYDGRSKTDTWKDLQTGKANVLVCQYQAGSTGLNLQNAHLMVFFEPHMSSLQFEQAQGRIYRKGQETRCVYYHLYTSGTIEEKVMRKVRSGVSVTNDMLQRWAQGEIF